MILYNGYRGFTLTTATQLIRWEVAGPHEVPASPQPPSYGMPSDSESHWITSIAPQ